MRLVRGAVDDNAAAAVAGLVWRTIEMAAGGHAATAEFAVTERSAARRGSASSGLEASGVRSGHEDEGGDNGEEELHREEWCA